MPKSSAAKKPEPETATRHVGFCALCEGDFKLTTNALRHYQDYDAVKRDELVLVHHGFKRPGDGRIHGDCMVVNEVPYETSCEPLKPYLHGLHARKASFEEHLAALKAGAILYFQEYNEFASRRTSPHRDVYDMWAVGVTMPYEFERKVEREIGETKFEIKMLDREIARIEGWIARWVKKPVRSFDEVLDVERQKKAERAAVVAEKRAARDVKEQAKFDKREALFQKREALKVAIATEALRLASLEGLRLDDKARSKLATAVKNAPHGMLDRGEQHSGAYNAQEKDQAARRVLFPVEAQEALVTLKLAYWQTFNNPSGSGRFFSTFR